MKVSKYYRSFLRIYLNKKNKIRLKNKDFTIICNNCVGGVIYHELGERFNSPTINLYFESDDYIKFIENLEFYLQQPLIEINSDFDFPVGKLKDIKIYFMHYSSFDEAKNKWNKRKARINKNNLYVIFVQQNNCTDELLKRFDEISFEHKIAFTSKLYPNIKCSYYIPKTEQKNGDVIDLCTYKSKFTGKRWIDDFDFVNFLNKGKI